MRFIIFCLFCIQCRQKFPVSGKPLSTESGLESKRLPDYDSCKRAILQIKKKCRGNWPALLKNQKEKYFTDAVAQTIIPSWLGTSWDFNGTTETPGVGKIACGYFVTTVLRDAGIPLARVKLAQCASETMIRTLVNKQYIQRFSNIDMPVFIKTIKDGGYGLYIVGLDNHTGFIFRDSTGVWFIHSTFLGTRNVQKEPAAASPIIANSRYRIIGKISADEDILNKWIQ